MEFILLRLIQLSKRELGVINELYFHLNREETVSVLFHDGLPGKERMLINELIQIERDKREEYTALSRKINCEDCITEEQHILKKMIEYTLVSQDRLHQKLGEELWVVIKEISSKNTSFQLLVDELTTYEVHTVSVDQVLPYISTLDSAQNLHSEMQISISPFPAN